MNLFGEKPYVPYLSECEVSTGPKGEIANSSLIAHSDKFKQDLIKVSEGIYNIVGIGLATSTLIEGKTGNIIVDTGDSVWQAEQQKAAFAQVSDRPLSAVMYTHWHYASGARVWVPEGSEADTPIWAHRKVPQNLSKLTSDLGPMLMRRVTIQFGGHLPTSGPDAFPNIGLGPFLLNPGAKTMELAYVAPNRLINDIDEAEIDGVKFQFWQYNSDSDDTLIIYMPDRKVCINNHLWPTFYNIYTLRGEEFRDPRDLIDGLDKLLSLDIEHLINVHGRPISGRENVKRALTLYRDSIQYAFDQTIRGINLGLSGREIADALPYPEELAEFELLGEHYGEFSHSIRQIYNGMMGWFGNDTAELNPVPLHVEAERIVDGFGGRNNVLKCAAKAIEDGEQNWAAQLMSYLLRLDPEDSEARGLKAKCLRYMGQRTPASVVRNWYLEEAVHLEGKIDITKPVLRTANLDMMRQNPPGTFVRSLRFRLHPGKAQGLNKKFTVRFTELGRSFHLVIRNRVAVFGEGDLENPDFKLELERDVWLKHIVGLKPIGESIDDGLARLDGDRTEFDAFIGLFH
ncbi:MAG: MBL fold metallo-hydrolase [Notoacmeibacter sp.]|nr:MBL fold metallo-hydrolase [Notoacmeibacter sp.]